MYTIKTVRRDAQAGTEHYKTSTFQLRKERLLNMKFKVNSLENLGKCRSFIKISKILVTVTLSSMLARKKLARLVERIHLLADIPYLQAFHSILP